ncbi:hypothetical protein SNE40_018425 [Patella caerulea]|uniref:UDP-N-acetylglucosamine transporter n=1 Tax=Patella caerulea TaxID=87958 RepID=A0AAN8JBS8_PATCE
MWIDSDYIHVARYGSVSHTGLIRNYSSTKLEDIKPKNRLPDVDIRLPITYIRNIVYNLARNMLEMDKRKLVSLLCLVFQTSGLILTMRYSRTIQTESNTYLSSTVVVVSEIIKLISCIIIIILTDRRPWYTMESEVLNESNELLKLAVPAGLYTLQNNLQFVAVSNLDAATFQVTYQLKILTTALFSVVFLSRRLTRRKWISLIILTLGISLVQLTKSKSCIADNDPACNNGDVSIGEHSDRSAFIGLLAVLIMCLSSGFAGVYFEKILKSSKQSLWTRNIQLAVPSIILGMIGVIYVDGSSIIEKGFFQGYTTITWFVVLQQAYLGLVISVVIKYADNIVKGFAAAISIIFSSLVTVIFLQDLILTSWFLIGTFLVLTSTVMYSVHSSSYPTRSQISV